MIVWCFGGFGDYGWFTGGLMVVAGLVWLALVFCDLLWYVVLDLSSLW